uniref:Uncharacterized protein n=1 Tax=viral metagenome TaxID=1070528 RepID=A0A6M3MCZ6_9ZZZZ
MIDAKRLEQVTKEWPVIRNGENGTLRAQVVEKITDEWMENWWRKDEYLSKEIDIDSYWLEASTLASWLRDLERDIGTAFFRTYADYIDPERNGAPWTFRKVKAMVSVQFHDIQLERKGQLRIAFG